mmetsp:Transcript_189/g.498  ORF Transcript_189/g.498 Transcript_189/m.498 type:complete len:107 (-) Transcript_189:136-456(-)
MEGTYNILVVVRFASIAVGVPDDEAPWQGATPTAEERELGRAAAAAWPSSEHGAPPDDASVWLARTAAMHRHALVTLPGAAGTHAMPATAAGWAARTALMEAGWEQ